MGVLPIGKNPHHYLYPFALGAFPKPQLASQQPWTAPYTILRAGALLTTEP